MQRTAWGKMMEHVQPDLRDGKAVNREGTLDRRQRVTRGSKP